eukprot:gene4344-4597_t
MEPIPISSVPVQQLAQIRQSLQESVESLAEQHAMLTRVAIRSSAAVKSVENLAESKTDQPVLLPLTSSLYVKGKLADTEKVLVNIGTDYFVEMSIEKATDYCRRRTLKIQQQQQGLQKVLQQKRSQLMQVTSVMQDKLQAGA